MRTMLAVLFLLACQNTCQQMCTTMADYAIECKLNATEEDVQACQDSYAAATPELQQTCAEAGDPDQLREWWSCDELAENFGKSAK